MTQFGIVSLFSLLIQGDKTSLSASTCEEVARALCALANNQRDRGKIVADGGVRTLLVLHENNTPEGKKLSAHALARIAISVDPKNYSSTTGTQIILPIMSLLQGMEETVEVFEGLMALTNLALLGPRECELIQRDNGLSKIEMFQISQNPHMQRVATELLTNLLMIDQDYFASFRDYEKRETAITLFGAFMQSDDIGARYTPNHTKSRFNPPILFSNLSKQTIPFNIKLQLKT